MYFDTSISTIEELKAQYRDLIKKYHPDIEGGSNEAMKTINFEYEKLFKQIEQGFNEQEQKEIHHNINDGFREILEKIIFLPDITIEIIGSWVWLSGNTYAVYKQIKEANFKFSKCKKSWYWYSGIDEQKHKYRGRYTMAQLREKHGSSIVENAKQLFLQGARA